MDRLSDAERGFREICGHLVGLSCSHCVATDHSAPGYFIISGFLVSINEDWYIATASHVLEEVDSLLRTQSNRTYSFRIVDHFGPSASHTLSIPFDYQGADRYRTDYEATGADFGLIKISDFYRNQMRANPQTPIDQESWGYEMDFEPTAYLTLGIPHEAVASVGESVDGRCTINSRKFEVVGLRVSRILQPPPEILNKDYPTFWAELSETPELSSIKGMSGCPILAFGKTASGNVKYEVTAVQSGWYHRRKPRIIFGSDFRSVMQDAKCHLVQRLS